MIVREADLKFAAQKIAACERDLNRTLSLGERRDLLCDNSCWSTDLVASIVDSLSRGHGVGAFHLAKARDEALCSATVDQLNASR